MAIADMYGFGLQTAGYYVAAFPDPASFLHSLEVGVPDLLVLDWTLPVMSGADLLHRLRKDARAKDVPVIVLSALPGIAGRELEVALSYGVLTWLVKSNTTPDRLAKTIAETVPPSGAAN